MASPVLFGCVSGFLGAGKTTAIAAAARRLQQRGLSVAWSRTTRATTSWTPRPSGAWASDRRGRGRLLLLPLRRALAGADRLLAEQPVDVLLAEAVGSCTDLVATVYRPLRRFFPRPLPTGALHGPRRARSPPRDDRGGRPVPDDVAYIFDRQIAEAELLVLNKSRPRRGPSARPRSEAASQRWLAGAPVLEHQRPRGDGVDAWVDRLLGERPPRTARSTSTTTPTRGARRRSPG